MCGGSGVSIRRSHPGRTARLLVGGVDAGVLGELHPTVRAAFDLPNQPVVVMEIDLEVLLAGWGAAAEMAGISTQPPVYEDLALIVDEAVPAAQVAALIRQSGGKLLADVRLFNVYRGGQIRGRQEVAGLRAHLPGARPHPDRRRYQEAARARSSLGWNAGPRRRACERKKIPKSSKSGCPKFGRLGVGACQAGPNPNLLIDRLPAPRSDRARSRGWCW